MDADVGWQLRLAYYVVAPPIVLLIFTTNALVLVLIFRGSKLRTRTNVCVASWAVCDVIIGLVLLAQVIFMGVHNLATAPRERETLEALVAVSAPPGGAAEAVAAAGDTAEAPAEAEVGPGDAPYPCLVWVGLQLLPVIVSCSHWVFMALERCVAVLDAVHYEQRITRMRVKLCVALVWLHGLAWAAVPLGWHAGTGSITGSGNGSAPTRPCPGGLLALLARHYALLLVVLHVLPCLLVGLALFARVFAHVRAHQRQVHVTHTLTQARLLADVAAARCHLAALLVSALCWAPFFVCALVAGAGPARLPVPERIQVATGACMLVGAASSAAKLPVYLLTDAHFRRSLRDMLAKRPPPLSRHRY